MERLDLNSICDIVYRLRRGRSERAIAKDLGHSRHTVRHYHNLAREKGCLDLHRAVPEPEELLCELGPAPSAPVIVSSVEPYRTVVEDPLKASVEMVTTHSRLVREHGTTHEAPLKRFSEVETSALMELPAEPFELVRVAQYTVARDTFISLDGSYYQAPYKLVGRKLNVYVYERTVHSSFCESITRNLERGMRLTYLSTHSTHNSVRYPAKPAPSHESAKSVEYACWVSLSQP